MLSPVIGEYGLDTQDLLLDGQSAFRQLDDIVRTGKAHVVEQAFGQPQGIVETDLLLGDVV